MNCFVFILIGLQLRSIISVTPEKQIVLYTLYGLLFSVAMMALRLIWVYSRSAIHYFKPKANCPQIIREAAVIGWSSMRGILSLTAALALPLVTGRDAVIYITFIVILVTLLVPSSTLHYLIRLLKIAHPENHHEVHQARKRLFQLAHDKLSHLREKQQISDREYDFLSNYFIMQRYTFEISSSHLKKMSDLESARIKIFEAMRKELLDMWEKQEIDHRLFRQIEHELDIQEVHHARAELK
jgi:CPA1 family monovalent cation:H+ antiporter